MNPHNMKTAAGDGIASQNPGVAVRDNTTSVTKGIPYSYL